MCSLQHLSFPLPYSYCRSWLPNMALHTAFYTYLKHVPTSMKNAIKLMMIQPSEITSLDNHSHEVTNNSVPLVQNSAELIWIWMARWARCSGCVVDTAAFIYMLLVDIWERKQKTKNKHLTAYNNEPTHLIEPITLTCNSCNKFDAAEMKN